MIDTKHEVTSRLSAVVDLCEQGFVVCQEFFILNPGEAQALRIRNLLKGYGGVHLGHGRVSLSCPSGLCDLQCWKGLVGISIEFILGMNYENIDQGAHVEAVGEIRRNGGPRERPGEMRGK
jgi:hypothetical protein